MSKEKQLLNAIITEDFHGANKLIKESLMHKLGNALEEKLVDFAPTVFNEGNLSPKQKKHLDKNKNGKIDGEDFKLLRKEDSDIDPEMNSIIESFEYEVLSLVEEVEQELGEKLSESEIMELADLYLSMLEEDNDVEQGDESEEDEEEYEEEEEYPQSIQPNISQSGVEY